MGAVAAERREVEDAGKRERADRERGERKKGGVSGSKRINYADIIKLMCGKII